MQEKLCKTVATSLEILYKFINTSTGERILHLQFRLDVRALQTRRPHDFNIA
jgi:hypothetical protein